MSNNAKVGGILSIVSGGLGAIGAFFVLIFTLFLYFTEEFSSSYYFYDYYYYDADRVVVVFVALYLVIAIIGLLISALALVGGIQALQRKRWGLALAGAIASCLTFFPCGVVAVVFTAMGRQEFITNRQPAPPQ
ncbi:MAG: hypothetical protein PVJ61_06070 [Dehalococcoidia bacterium]|jgi:hypothetical protein